MTVTAIDFETANPSHTSICAVGIAVFNKGNLIDSKHWFVRPPKGHGWFREEFIACHGINWSDVRDEPEFPGIATEIIDRLERADLVIAHNASFDMTKLRGTLQHFGIPAPRFNFLCTLKAARCVWPNLAGGHGLGALAASMGHQFRHHNAQDDAEAAGWLLYGMMRAVGASTPLELAKAKNIPVRTFCPQGA